ncbi:MAG: ATPase, T2SS/T4P/T4SS family [Thermoguttaceae bacterium]
MSIYRCFLISGLFLLIGFPLGSLSAPHLKAEVPTPMFATSDFAATDFAASVFSTTTIVVSNDPSAASVATPQPELAQPLRKYAQDKSSKQGKDILKKGWWGPGGYLSVIKLIAFVLVFFGWVYSVDWVSRDSELQKIKDRYNWICYNTFPFIIVGYILFNLPISSSLLFFFTFPLTVLLWIVPVMLYASARNKPLPPFEKVLTYDHIKFCIASLLVKVGIRIRLEKKMTYQVGPPIEISASGGGMDAGTLSGWTILARNHPGFNHFRKNIFESLERKTDAVLFELQQDRMLVRNQIDGVWLDYPPLEREQGEQLFASAKLLVGGTPEEHVKRQSGQLTAVLRKKKKYQAELIIQGAASGVEKALLSFVIQKVPFDSLDDIGMRGKLPEKVKQLVNQEQGLVVFSALPANGLKSTMNVVSRVVDRFTRDFVSVEDVQNPYQVVENVVISTYDSKKGENPMSVLGDVFFKEPQILLLRDIVNVQSLQLCCEEIENHRLIITTIRSKDAADAIVRLLAMKIQPQLLVNTLSAVVGQRLIRKLCANCKEAYTPPPAMLQRLGLPQDPELQLFRVPSPPEPGVKRKPCPYCNDIGYIGRTAIFEIIEVNDEIRKAVVTTPTTEAIRKAANQTGQRGCFADGTVLVGQGITSVEELARVLKQ